MEPEEFSFLNLNPNIIVNPIVRAPGDPYLSVAIFLDPEVEISERVVKGMIEVFGEIGGFQSFMLALISVLVGSIPGKLFQISKAEALFRANLDE